MNSATMVVAIAMRIRMKISIMRTKNLDVTNIFIIKRKNSSNNDIKNNTIVNNIIMTIIVTIRVLK